MNFLADENFPNTSCRLLEANNHHVRKAGILFTGKPDEEILSIAYKENEIILTFDKDFGELVFKRKLPLPAGLVLYRLKKFDPADPANIILNYIKNFNLVLNGFFTVISSDKIRQKLLKPVVL
jgi:predicted nuclease of predicted toxin-antitoxin system